MAIREKLREWVQPMLEPGETVQSVIPAQPGPSPWLAGAIGVLFYNWIWKPRLIAVTDRAVVLVQASPLSPFSAKRVLARLPRAPITVIRSGAIWSRVDVNGERNHVHKRFAKDLEGANASLSATSTPTEANPA